MTYSEVRKRYTEAQFTAEQTDALLDTQVTKDYLDVRFEAVHREISNAKWTLSIVVTFAALILSTTAILMRVIR